MSLAPWLRWIVYALSGIHTAALLVVLLIVFSSSSSDPLGRSIGIAIAMIFSVPWVVLTLPALALRNRAPRIALSLVIAAYVVKFVVWSKA